MAERGEYRFQIGDTITTNNRSLVIIERERRERIKKRRLKPSYITTERYYKYKCNVCGYSEGWVLEYGLESGTGCACCSSRITVSGINDITTTSPWMIKYFQGGALEAQKYSSQSPKRIRPICPNCGKQSTILIRINDLYKKHTISCDCKDHVSSAEKFLFDFLRQLKIDFCYQTNCDTFPWAQGKRYDFYIPSLSCIVETHGDQHYNEKVHFKGYSLKKEMENDEKKKSLAIQNGIQNYIVIDCRQTYLSWMKESIEKSGLFDVIGRSSNDVDYIACAEYAASSLMKQLCDYRKQNPDHPVHVLMKEFDISSGTVQKYLKKGSELGWISYSPHQERSIALYYRWREKDKAAV